MNCPIHKDVWLFENMTETVGHCPKCRKDYALKDEVNTRRKPSKSIKRGDFVIKDTGEGGKE